MAVPKRKTSKSKTKMRRAANSKMVATGFVSCPQCHEPKLPHRVCPDCGYYKGKEVVGFYHGPEPVDNVWMDGTGHLICAFYSSGDIEKGNYYCNQFDRFIIEQKHAGKITHSIPYTANNKGGYPWVKLETGFVSVDAWYIFAKNKFNPMDF